MWSPDFRRSDVPGLTCILASIRCDFLSPIYHGEVVEVGVRVPTVGRTSFDFEYEAHVVGDGRVVARAHSTQVHYDRVKKEKIPIAEEWLAKITRAQGKHPRPRVGSSNNSPNHRACR